MDYIFQYIDFPVKIDVSVEANSPEEAETHFKNRLSKLFRSFPSGSFLANYLTTPWIFNLQPQTGFHIQGAIESSPITASGPTWPLQVPITANGSWEAPVTTTGTFNAAQSSLWPITYTVVDAGTVVNSGYVTIADSTTYEGTVGPMPENQLTTGET